MALPLCVMDVEKAIRTRRTHKAFAAEPVNIGGLYPVTGSFAQIGQGCVKAGQAKITFGTGGMLDQVLRDEIRRSPSGSGSIELMWK